MNTPPADAQPPIRVLVLGEPDAALARVLGAAGIAIAAHCDAHHLGGAALADMPDALLIDQGGGCALELARWLREQECLADLPIIFLSGEADPERRLQVLAEGADDVLPRAVGAAELTATVKARALRARRVRAARRAAQQNPPLLRRADRTLIDILDGLPAIIYAADMQTHRMIFANRYMREALGRDDLVGQLCWQVVQEGQSGPCDFCTNDRLIDADGKPAAPYVWQFRNTANGRWYHIHDRAIEWLDGRTVRLEIALDVTQRIAAEERLRRLTRIYAALNHCNQAIFGCSSETELYANVCRAAVELGGMKMAWIGLTDPDTGEIRAVARFGAGADDRPPQPGTADEAARFFGKCPAGASIRENRPVFCQDPQCDAAPDPGAARADGAGTTACASLPLQRGGVSVGRFNLYADQPDGFDEAARSLLIELASRIGMVLDGFDREADRKRAEGALRIVAEDLSAESGADFFETLALRLSKLLGADFALVGKLSRSGQAVETIGLVTPEGVAPNIEYALAGTPCATLFDSGYCIHHAGVATLFPADRLLVDLQVEAYAGVPLVDAAGGPIGIIAVLWRRPLRPDEHPEHILRIFSARAAAELTRSRTEAELRLTRISVEAASDGLFWVTADARFVDVNAAACELLGYSREQLLQRGVADVVPRHHPRQWQHFFARIGRHGSLTLETTLRHRDGRLIPVEIVAGHVEVGHEARICSFVRDITERRRAKEVLIELNEALEERVARRTEELLAAKDEAERANLSKSEFLSSMSHELRTPLNAILGFSQLLRADPLAPLSTDQTESLDEILGAGNHLLALINEVLDLARIESGRLELAPEPVELAALFQESLSLMRPLANAHRVRLSGSAPEGYTLRIDRLRLRQLLLNLLSNAIKYNRDGGQVRLECRSAPGEVHISVHDSGIGIDPEFLPHLFKPFERQRASSRRVEGTGIGLALCKRLLEAMGGTISVESEPGVGSVFRVTLPGAAVPAALPAPAPSARGAPRGAPATLITHTLLYVEDNAANLRLVHKILAQHPQLRLMEATSAEAGLELAYACRPDLILMDIGLPGMSGVEALARLRQNPALRDTPVVALSANAMPADIAAARAAGFADYLTKPLDVARFQALIVSMTK